MDLTILSYSVAATLSVLLFLFVVVLLTLVCIHFFRNKKLNWKSSVSSSELMSKSWDMAFDGSIEQIDVDRIMRRRQERTLESDEGEADEQEHGTRSLEHIDNDTATVLAVDQLLDTSFLISDDELSCYAPPVDVKIVAVRRDHV